MTRGQAHGSEGGSRTTRDKAVIAALAILLVALVCGVAWGVCRIVSIVGSQQRDLQEVASYEIPATPSELLAEQAASSVSAESLVSWLSGATTALAEEAPVEEAPADATPVEEAPVEDAATDAAAADAAGATEVAADPVAEAEQAAAASATADGEVIGGASSSGADASSSSDMDKLVDNPIDFTALKEQYPDIYAWIYIPNTGINLPVLQSATDDSFYLTHNAKGEYDVWGSVYSELANKTDFSDPVTVIYGHDGEAQFMNLHYYEDKEFFNNPDNEFMYVYTTGHIYTYRVIAAYKYDNRHILNSFDFTDQAVLQSYYDYILNPDSLLLNVREGVTLDATKDKIIQLSTCMLDEFHGSSRYIVTGVLVDDQPTR